MTFRGNIGACRATGNPCPVQSLVRAGMSLESSPRASLPIVIGRLLMGLVIAGVAPVALMAQSHPSSPPPHASSPPHPPPAPHPSAPHPSNAQHPPAGQQHLSEWMQKNQGLTQDQQIKKLQQEQGFNRLTPQQQQSATDHLRQLNQKSPEQRQRDLERVENMEHLAPQQQQQVRASARMLGQMPPERQQAVKDAIRNLRNVPPGLRQSELNSKYGSQLSPEERGVAGNLLSVESYHPPPPPPR